MSAPSAINNARQIIIGASAGITTTTLKNATFIANTGEVGIFTPEGLRILETGSSPAAGVSVAATSEMDFVLAISRGASKAPIVSDVIKGSSITVANKGVYAAAVEESLAVGYNGTSGLIADVATYAGELYKVSILVHQFMSGTDSEHLKAGYYQSQLTDGQAEIALGIAASVNKNFSREVSNSDGDKPVVAEVVCNNAGAEALSASDTIVGSKGSTQLNITEVGGVLPYLFVVGDYIRLGTATSANVYKILATTVTVADGGILTLDRELTEDFSPTAGTGTTEYITAALGAAADWGVLLKGKSLPFDRDKKRYAKCRFDVVLDSAFGSTAVSTLASASEGLGTYEAISQLENFLARMMSESYEMGQPFINNITSDLLADSAVAGGGYDLITLKFSDSRVVSFQNEVSPKELVLAIPFTTPAYAGSGTDDITDVLEDIIPANALIPADLAL
jgi:hypothetical protein